MEGLVKIADASLQLLELNQPPFLGSTTGFEMKGREELRTIMCPSICNLEPDGYGSDLRNVFRDRTIGGYLLSNPFEANPDLSSKKDANSVVDFLLNIHSNSAVESFLFAHPKIGLRLIHATDYQIHLSKSECMGLMERLATDLCDAEEHLTITAAMDATYEFDEKWFATAEILADHIETVISRSIHNLCENNGFKRIVASLIGFRTVYADPLSTSGVFFLTRDQLACIDSKARIQFIHGEQGVGKTTTLLLKMFDTARWMKKRNIIGIIVANQVKADRFISIIRDNGVGGNFTVHWVNEEGDDGFEFPLDDVANLNCEWLFIDEVATISHAARVWLEGNKELNLICTLTKYFPRGVQQSREWFQWIHLRGRRDATMQHEIRQAEDMSEKQIPSIEKDYFSLSISTMKRFYPYWMDLSCTTTTCIPACIDIIHKIKAQRDRSVSADGEIIDERISLEGKAKYAQLAAVAGRNAETTVFQAIQRLSLGGVLVAEFNTRNFWNKVRDNKRVEMNSKIRTNIKQFLTQYQDFESDVLFFHPRLGIFVIEVKSASKVNQESEQYKTAKSQLHKMVRNKIPALYEILTEEKLNVPINGALCFPNADFSQFPTTPSEWIRFDQTILSDEEAFREFWVKKIEENSQKDYNYFSDTAFHRFICAIVAYRCTAVVSHAINALEMYDILDSQNFLKIVDKPLKSQMEESDYCSPKTVSIKLNDIQERTFFLNDQQLAIYENEMKASTIEIICGPPGTGKTLLIVLKALKAAKEDRSGRVLVKTRPSLVPKLRLMLKANRKPNDREVVVLDAVVDNQDDHDEDDYFADEFDVTLDREHIYKRRSRCAGRTFVAITGGLTLSDIPMIKETFELHSHCVVHELRQVIRGTKHIVDFWKSDLQLSMGHSAVGHRVERYCLRNSNLILAGVLEKIKTFLAAAKNTKFGPKDLAIIVSDWYFAEYIKTFLAVNQISCGSAEEQLRDENLIAVISFDLAVSYEWPVVLAVDFLRPNFKNSFKMISSSRAIAHLIVFERDQRYAHNFIDEKINEQITTGGLEGAELAEIFEVVQRALNEIGENETVSIYHDYFFLLARTSYLPKSLQSVDPFTHCRNLFDLINTLTRTDNKYLLRSIAAEHAQYELESVGSQYQPLLKTLRRQGRGRAILKNRFRPSQKLFEELLASDLQKQALMCFVERFAKIQEELTCELDQFGSFRFVFHSEFEDHILLQLSQNAEWHQILSVIEIFSDACTYKQVHQ